ncbi:MAG: GNAT family N-acetyltransferase [Polyangiaceae bacterium]|nr:GNAT family N-acetyltransferase [Polyangiaceae bacterium]
MSDVAIVLRPATAEDCRRVYEWANDPVTRRASFHSAEITWAEHSMWFEASLANPRRQLFIGEADGEPCALLRLDHGPDQCAEIGINLAPGQRGRRLGTPLLRAASQLAESSQVRRLVAHIKPDNPASLRTFVSAGYQPAGEATVAGCPALRYELEVTSHV